MKQIFPQEIIENTVEVVHRFKHNIKSHIIYGILILAILSIGASLPFVSVDIYSTSQGFIKSEKERNQITSLYSGKITALFIKENKYVQKGDTLLIIDNTIGKGKITLISNQLEEVKMFTVDLKHLSNSKILDSILCTHFYIKNNIYSMHKNIKNSKPVMSKQKEIFLDRKICIKKKLLPE